MNPSESNNILELAKQGNPQAIASLMNRQLKPKGITVKAGLKGDCLQIFLESVETPDRNLLIPLIEKGMTNLGVKTIRTVKVYGRQAGFSTTSWTGEFPLATFVESSAEFVSDTFDNSPESNSPVNDTPKVKSSPNPRVSPNSYQNPGNSQDTGFNIQNTFQDALEGLKIFVINPVGGLPELYLQLGKKRALAVGIAFGIFYAICLLFSIHKTLSTVYFLSSYSRFNIAQIVGLAVTQFISLAVASILTRKIFKGFGSPEGDVFIAGTSLLAPGLLIFFSTILGGINFEIILILFVGFLTYLILTLYTGCNQISKIPDSLSPVAVVVMLLLSIWFSKIIISSALY